MEDTTPMTSKHWKTLVTQTQAQLNSMNVLVDQALKEEHYAPRVLWEVYTGRARLSQVAEAIGVTVKTFGFETGWNFALQLHQRAFLELQDREMPDETHGHARRTSEAFENGTTELIFSFASECASSS